MRNAYRRPAPESTGLTSRQPDVNRTTRQRSPPSDDRTGTGLHPLRRLSGTVRVMTESDLDIRTLRSAAEMTACVTVFNQVWGTVTPLVSVELLMAITHGGGYVAGAYEHDNIVGASFGFLADHRGERALHSHVTGILQGVQHGGV